MKNKNRRNTQNIATCENLLNLFLNESIENSIKNAQNSVFITPVKNYIFIKASQKLGILPILIYEIILTIEILENNIKNESNLEKQKLIKYKQKQLEKIASCVYEYISKCNFNMPGNTILAEAVGILGNKLLRNVMKKIEENYEKYGAKIIKINYKEIMLNFPNKTISQAKINAEKIISEISEIKISLKSVFQPYFQITTECFCGINHISKEPIFSHKRLNFYGINCDFIYKTMEKILENIIKTKDLSETKRIFQKEITKLVNNEIFVNDLIFTRKIKFTPNSFLGAAFKKLIPINRFSRNEDCIQYLISEGNENSMLSELILSVDQFINEKRKVNLKYYINKLLVNSVNTILEIFGINCEIWVPNFAEIPKKSRKCKICNENSILEKSQIYCEFCSQLSKSELNEKITLLLKETQQKLIENYQKCQNCAKTLDFSDENQGCNNLHCIAYLEGIELKNEIFSVKDIIKKI